MDEHRPAPQLNTPSELGLKAAADLVGRSTKTLLRWCKDGSLPNARKIAGPKGPEWCIPANDLLDAANAKGIAIIDIDRYVQTSTPNNFNDKRHVRTSNVHTQAEPVEHVSTADLAAQQQQLLRAMEHINKRLSHLITLVNVQRPFGRPIGEHPAQSTGLDPTTKRAARAQRLRRTREADRPKRFQPDVAMRALPKSEASQDSLT